MFMPLSNSVGSHMSLLNLHILEIFLAVAHYLSSLMQKLFKGNNSFAQSEPIDTSRCTHSHNGLFKTHRHLTFMHKYSFDNDIILIR